MGDTARHEEHEGIIVEVLDGNMPTDFLIDIYALHGRFPDDFLVRNFRYNFYVPKTGQMGLCMTVLAVQSCRMVLTENTIHQKHWRV